MTTERPEINLRTIAPLVAKAMGPTWKAKLPSEGETHHADLIGPDGARVSMGADSYRQRISLSGYIDYKDRQNFLRSSDGPVPRATVSPTKLPEAIAKDITRRILPDYLPLLAKVHEAKAKSDEEVVAKLAVAETLAKAIGGAVRKKDGMYPAVDHRWSPVEVRTYESRLFGDDAGSTDLHVHSPDRVQLKITTTEAEMLAILAAIDTHRNAGGRTK